MNVVIIGSGNVATHLGKAFYHVGLRVTQVWSAHVENASLLAKQINAAPITSLNEIDMLADLCIIAVKDDAIPEIAGALTGFNGIIVHTSGAVELDVFANGFENFGVFYPLQTFSKNRAVDFNTIPLCVEANNAVTLMQLKKIASKLSSDVRQVSSKKRKILHLAAVFACNFTNHMYALAGKILEEHSLDFDILCPLILETAAKVQNDLPLTAQTGPAVRNDEETLITHQSLLADHPQCLAIYKTLSESIKKTRS